MSQSLSCLFVHIIFHIKNHGVLIENDIKNELYSYIGQIIKDTKSSPILINGTNDHVHILCIMSKNIALAKFVEEIKKHSSRWIKTKSNRYKNFFWQGGYAGFSVSPSLYEKTKNYIRQQEEHHKKQTFREELEVFLKKYGVDYDVNYLFED